MGGNNHPTIPTNSFVKRSTMIKEAAKIINKAYALVIIAGVGMRTGSRPADACEDEGFWESHPFYEKLGLTFSNLLRPDCFFRDPELAWGFYGYRLNLCRKTIPHKGYKTLLNLGKSKPGGYFVFTSNIDGLFQKAGFDEERIVECHGSIHYLQRIDGKTTEIWPADEVCLSIDETGMRALHPLPLCLDYQSLARPNILMVEDGYWVTERVDDQLKHFQTWLSQKKGRPLAVIECGASGHPAMGVIRLQSEHIIQKHPQAQLIRLCPSSESTMAHSGIALSMGISEAICQLSAAIQEELSEANA